ncbi:MAG: signal peptidase II [Kiritimatiellae bacterium]|nr:signal peptidase II [Kiritimatiellia bacterium]
MRRLLLVFAAVANILLADALTKELAAGYLKGSAAVSVIDGFFNLAYVENRGCAWGMLQGQSWPLAAFGVLALALLVWKRQSVFFEPGRTGWGRGLGAVAEPLLYAGIVGNLIDRVFRGYVIDFLDFHWGEAYHFPCFNIADVCITLAAAFLLAGPLLTRRS